MAQRPTNTAIRLMAWLAMAAAAVPAAMAPAWAQPAAVPGINAGGRPASRDKPFAAHAVASFHTPWALAFLPDGRLLVTEKGGRLYLVTQGGAKTGVGGVPEVAASGQNGLLDVAVSPDYATSRHVYLTYVEPGETSGRLVLARATLADGAGRAGLDGLAVLWRQEPEGGGGQPGGMIAFDPAGRHLFLTVGDRMDAPSAQDASLGRGKVLRLGLDGSTPPDNPNAKAGGVVAQTWTTGHRNPYGLAFAPDGKLWEHEMGPMGGDELNLIEAGRNYGWPLVSNGDNYDGTPIPRHATRPDLDAPELYWNPVIAPAGLAFYTGSLFPGWRGAALIGGLRSQALVLVRLGSDGRPDEAARWRMGARIRDVAVAPDGAVWVIEDRDPGRLLRLTPTGAQAG